jgi:hypothetical protein
MVLRILIALHRWLGVSLCLLFLLWFPSGIGMMYWGMPAVTARDRLERAPVLDASRILLSAQEAADRVAAEPSLFDVRIRSFDGRPVYRFGGGRGGGPIVYADTGQVHERASATQRRRLAAAWTRLPADGAEVDRGRYIQRSNLDPPDGDDESIR